MRSAVARFGIWAAGLCAACAMPSDTTTRYDVDSVVLQQGFLRIYAGDDTLRYRFNGVTDGDVALTSDDIEMKEHAAVDGVAVKRFVIMNAHSKKIFQMRDDAPPLDSAFFATLGAELVVDVPIRTQNRSSNATQFSRDQNGHYRRDLQTVTPQ
jgi:hypothetical protein